MTGDGGAPARDQPEHLVVGHVTKAHGTKGEIFVWPLTDREEEVEKLLAEEKRRLEQLAGMSAAEAKAELIRRIEEEAQAEAKHTGKPIFLEFRCEA